MAAPARTGVRARSRARGVAAVRRAKPVAAMPSSQTVCPMCTAAERVRSISRTSPTAGDSSEIRFGTAAGDATTLDGPSLLAALRAGLEGIVARGRAEAGDKTMYDALAPAVAALEAGLEAGEPLAAAVRSAADAAAQGREATMDMLALKGRASYLGERSVGHIDPGAASSALLVAALADAVR